MSEFFLAADMAEALAAVGLTCRTPAAVRSAIDDGRLQPDLRSPRGVKAWSLEALQRDVALMHRRQRMRALAGLQALREPQQLLIGG